MTALSASYPTSKSIHKYANTNLDAVTAQRKMSSQFNDPAYMLHRLMLEGDYCSLSFCNAVYNCINRGLKFWRKDLWIQDSSLPMPSSSTGPARSFLSDPLLFFSPDTCFLGAFATISSFQVTHFMNTQPAPKC